MPEDFTVHDLEYIHEPFSKKDLEYIEKINQKEYWFLHNLREEEF